MGIRLCRGSGLDPEDRNDEEQAKAMKAANHARIITEAELIDKCRVSAGADEAADARRGGAGACGNADRAAAERLEGSSRS